MSDTAEHIRIYEDQTPEVGLKPSGSLKDISEDSEGRYINQIGNHPILTREQEVELAKLMEQGKEAEEQLAEQQPEKFSEKWNQLNQQIEAGATARQHFIGCNLKLVIYIAKKFQGRGLPLGDLINEGNIGVIKGVDKFDWRKGFKFSTYAAWWIRQSIMRALDDTARTIRLPVKMRERQRRAYKQISEFEMEYGREPTKEEYADLVGIALHEVDDFKSYFLNSVSLDTPVNPEEPDAGSRGDFIPAKTNTESEAIETLEAERYAEALEASLANLTERERQAIEMHLGVVDDETHSLREIAKSWGVSPESARQTFRDAEQKLQKGPEGIPLRLYLDSRQ